MLPNTEFVGSHEVTLPLHPLMDSKTIRYIVEVIHLILQNDSSSG